MRKIEYIFIDSDCQANDSKSRHHALPNFGYHFVINRWSSEHHASPLEHCRVATEVGKPNSQGLVLRPTNIDIPAKLIPGPIYDRDKYNKCSICIRYCGSLRPEVWLIDPNTSCNSVMQQRAALLKLLVQLRSIYPSAKILGVSELDGKALHSKNIIVSDTMNVLRSELSNYP